MFFLSSIFFVKSFTQVCELYSDHQVENEECSEQHAKDEEGVVPVGLLSFSNNIHHISPAFKRDNLEYIQDRHENVIEVKSVRYWILVLQTLRILNHIIWQQLCNSWSAFMLMKAEDHAFGLS